MFSIILWTYKHIGKCVINCMVYFKTLKRPICFHIMFYICVLSAASVVENSSCGLVVKASDSHHADMGLNLRLPVLLLLVGIAGIPPDTASKQNCSSAPETVQTYRWAMVAPGMFQGRLQPYQNGTKLFPAQNSPALSQSANVQPAYKIITTISLLAATTWTKCIFP